MTLPLRPLRSGLGLALVLLGANAGAQEPAQVHKQTFAAVKKEFDQEFRDMRATAMGLPEEEVTSIYEDFFANVLPDFAERYAVLGRAQRGTPLAYDSWSEIVSLGTMSDTSSARGTGLLEEALNSLTTDHAQSESLAGLAGNLRFATHALGEERVAKTLKDIVARSPHRAVKAAALYSLGAMLGDGRPAGDPRIVEAKAVFAQLQKDFADVEFCEERSYAQAASAGFRLADYKGKVVLVDFWGFW